jgi:shikimate dehydrogenase
MLGSDDRRRRFYLLGHGIQKSFSPAMWNGVFDRLGLDACYGLLDLDSDGLDAARQRLREPDVVGFNVTMPYKAWAAAQAQIQVPDVARSGVCNWIQARNGQIAAANTDIQGARALLDAVPPSDRVLLLGAGGTAAAMLTALEGRTGAVVIANRTHERAVALARRASTWLPDVRAVAWSDRMAEAPDADLIINTTPLGMRDDLSPLEEMRPREGARIYDAVYRSELTPLQRQAAAWGLPLADGLAHLEAQAVALLPYFGLAPQDADLVRTSLASAVGHEPHRWTVPRAGA